MRALLFTLLLALPAIASADDWEDYRLRSHRHPDRDYSYSDDYRDAQLLNYWQQREMLDEMKKANKLAEEANRLAEERQLDEDRRRISRGFDELANN